MITMPIELDNLGHVAGFLRVHPAEITRAVEVLGIVPSRLNGVPFFTPEQTAAIRAHLAGPALPAIDPLTALQIDSLGPR